MTSHPDAPTMDEAAATGTPSFSPGSTPSFSKQNIQNKFLDGLSGNFEMHEAAYRREDKLEARSGQSLESLNSQNMKCIRTSCGTAMCANVDDQGVDEMMKPYMQKLQSVPAFGMSDTLLPGERCYALGHKSAREFLNIDPDSTFDPNDRIFLCGKNKPSAMMAPVVLANQIKGFFK